MSLKSIFKKIFNNDRGDKLSDKVIVRIPPSPTGNLHVGTARTAIFNYLFAKQNKGEIVFRFEDTDKERSKEEYEKDILEGLEWLGMSFGKIYKQSERTDVYKKYLEKLLKENKAYISKEAEGDRKEVIRFKNPNKEITFNDKVRGDITFDTTELGDFVIAKSLTEPLYHLTVVVDDYEMKISHIIRGEDGISNTPRQILIQEAIGAPRPIYVHLPLVLGKDKSKLSKRHGATSISEYKNQGYLSEALFNYLAFLGWNPKTDKEIYSIDELIKDFNLDQIQKAGAIFDIEKLDWFNSQHLKSLPKETLNNELLERLSKYNIPENIIDKIKPLIIERIDKWSDIDELSKEGEFDYYISDPRIIANKISWKDSSISETKEILDSILEILSKMDSSDFSKEKVKEVIWPFAEEKGRGSVLWPFRYALSGKEKSPDPFTLAEILGKDLTLHRIENAIKNI